MTREEVYDLACKKVSDPAVLVMGDRHLIGQWVVLGEYDETTQSACVLKTKARGVLVLAQGPSWESAVRCAEACGWALPSPNAERTTNTRMVTIADAASVCKTYGCNEPRKPGDPFCPKCFEEHRAQVTTGKACSECGHLVVGIDGPLCRPCAARNASHAHEEWCVICKREPRDHTDEEYRACMAACGMYDGGEHPSIEAVAAHRAALAEVARINADTSLPYTASDARELQAPSPPSRNEDDTCENRNHHDGYGLLKKHCLRCAPRKEP